MMYDDDRLKYTASILAAPVIIIIALWKKAGRAARAIHRTAKPRSDTKDAHPITRSYVTLGR